MPFTGLAFHVAGDVAVIEPASRESLCDDHDGLAPFIVTLLDRGFSKVVLDLHRVEYIDSLALSGLVRAYRLVTQDGGKLKLANVVQRVRDLLEATKLASVFELFDSNEAALRSFEATVSSQT